VAGFSRSYMTAWSDGWVSPPLAPSPLLCCRRCGRVALRGDFATLGVLERPLVHCRVDVLQAGDRPVEVMKAVREITNRSLAETKQFVASLPATLLGDVFVDKADEAQQKLERAGARVGVIRTEEGGSSREWLDAPRVDEIDEPPAILRFLDAHALSREDEAALRLHLLHLWNHPYREKGVAWIPPSARDAEQARNAQRLVELRGGEVSPDAPLTIAAVPA
jgi:hypothetical protein